jgi:hypothetical protein
VDEAAKAVASVHAGQRRGRVTSSGSGGGSVGRLEVERTVRPPVVVMVNVNAEHVLELAAADNEEPVETLSADAADPAFDVRVRVGRTGARMILTPSLAKTASNAAANLLSRS